MKTIWGELILPDPLNIFIGWDSREVAATEVASNSIKRRTKSLLNIHFLKHRDLRKRGIFTRPWLIDAQTGDFSDLMDGKPFSTEFSHTRFLVPALMNFNGWALFFDADMIFLNDIQKLFDLRDDKYAVMCVKHNQKVAHNAVKMDDRQQTNYFRKNWSSFVLWNCAHPANKHLTKEHINFVKGSDLHSFGWLDDSLIGSLPHEYNYISGVSPKLPPASGNRPAVVHYTEGGPWFENCRDVPYADFWLEEYEEFQRSQEDGFISNVPTMAYDREEV